MIEIPPDDRAAMVAHARAAAPREACGILGGAFGADRSRVGSVHRAENVAALPRTEYAVDPEEQYRIFERIEDEGEDVVGFYHSHPAGPAGPSATDAARAYWPDRSYVIVILDGEGSDDRGSDGTDEGSDDPDSNGSDGAEPTVGSWRWTGDRFDREPVLEASE